MKQTLRIATRQSPLAMWQAEFVRDKLLDTHADLHVDILGMTTRGDQILDKSLSKIGGKGLFVKELESALLDNRADIAVHSMKDVGVELPDALMIGAIMSRHSPFDAVVSAHTLAELPDGAVIGTSSLRRMCQLQHAFPALTFKPLRGNVNTRLAKLDAGEFDAIILAEAGLVRLGMSERIKETLSPGRCLPGIAQGTLGIECRRDDTDTLMRIAPLVDARNTLITLAERAVNDVLNGSCQTPIAAYATWSDEQMQLTGLVASPKTFAIVQETRSQMVTTASQANMLGKSVGDALLSKGAADFLAEAD